MTVERETLSAKISIDQLNHEIISSIDEVKGKNVMVLDMRRLGDAPTDFFIVCEGASNTQVKAISDKIYRNIKQKHGILPNHIEGQRKARWILIDYFNTVVHIFHPEAREFYELEDLWSDADVTEYNNL